MGLAAGMPSVFVRFAGACCGRVCGPWVSGDAVRVAKSSIMKLDALAGEPV